MPTLGHSIRARRLELGLTLAVLSARIGCGKGYLSQIENGRRHHAPSEHLLRRLERALSLADGSLITLGRWDHVPPDVRAAVHALTEARDRTRRVLALVERRGLSDAFHSGELAGAIDDLITSVREADTHAVPIGAPPRIHILHTDGEFVRVPDVYDPEAFGVRITTDAMAPGYRTGDIAIFGAADPDPADRADCFVRFITDLPPAFARIFFHRDALNDPCVRLQPLNFAHPPRTVRRDEIASIHPCLFAIRALRNHAR